MLLVKTYLAPSAIHGIGCFATEPIRKGARIWQLDRGRDVVLNVQDAEHLPDDLWQYLRDFTYRNIRSQQFILCCDNAKFWNHSARPNTSEVYPEGDCYGFDMAACDISVGEEITTDYRGFDDDWQRKLDAPPHPHQAGKLKA